MEANRSTWRSLSDLSERRDAGLRATTAITAAEVCPCPAGLNKSFLFLLFLRTYTMVMVWATRRRPVHVGPWMSAVCQRAQGSSQSWWAELASTFSSPLLQQLPLGHSMDPSNDINWKYICAPTYVIYTTPYVLLRHFRFHWHVARSVLHIMISGLP